MEPPASSHLHHSQKFFWYVTSLSIIALTAGFLFALFTGKATSIKAAMFEMTLKEAAQTVTVSTSDLSGVRKAIIDARNAGDEAAFGKAMADFDEALKKLGVAQEVLEKAKLNVRKALGYSLHSVYYPVYQFQEYREPTDDDKTSKYSPSGGIGNP